MNRIWKYGVDPRGGAIEFEFFAPIGAKPLAVQRQDADTVLWMQVDPDQPNREELRFAWVGTGVDHEYPADQYIGTCQFNDGRIVLHLFGPLS